MEREALVVKQMRARLDREMCDFTENDVTADTLDSVEHEIGRIKDKKSDYQDKGKSLCTGGPEVVQEWSRCGPVNLSILE